jgi:spore germination protein
MSPFGRQSVLQSRLRVARRRSLACAVLLAVLGAVAGLDGSRVAASVGRADHRYAVSAWSLGSLTSLVNASKAKALDDVDLDIWRVHANGEVDTGHASAVLIRRARVHGIKVFATVANISDSAGGFDAAVTRAILATPKTRQASVSLLVTLCVKRGYDGIDLDWELIKAYDRNRFSAYVALLAKKLHAVDKRLSIAVYAKTTEYPRGHNGTTAAENYASLGRSVDELEIMTYDHHRPSTSPGPVSPLRWMGKVLDYAESRVAPAKIRLGIPFYGYDWSGGSAHGLLWADAQTLIRVHHARVRRSPSGEAFFHYRDRAGALHTVFFQDRRAIAVKMNFVRALKPAIGGIAIWVMGGENPAFWPVIHAVLK